MSKRRVIPLESNPDIFNELAYKLGLTPILEFHDLYSLTDPDLLAFIPQPVFGIILLFPLTDNYEAYRETTDLASGLPYNNANVHNVRWFKQTIGNACGLYALLHLVANLAPDLIVNGSMLKENLLGQITQYTSVDDVSRLVEAMEGEIQLDNNFGSQGQTEAPLASDTVDLHFVTFVKSPVDGHLYELDGRRNGPIDLGKASPDNRDTSNVLNEPKIVEKIQFYMESADEKNRHNFSVMAMAPS